MSHVKTDDLFEQSTMTFGEHLEEFRVALVKALIGLVVGVVIAIPFAMDTVDMIKSPLEKALHRVEQKKAYRKLTELGEDSLSPESWTLLEDEGMVPERVRLNVDDLIAQLTDIGVAERSDNKDYFLRPDQIENECQSIARTLRSASRHFMKTPAKTVWKQLTEGEQEQVVQIAKASEITDVMPAQLVAILNRLIANPALATIEPFDKLNTLYKIEGQRQSIEQLRETVDQNEVGHERLNRWLLAAGLDAPEIAIRPRTMEVRLWQLPKTRIQALNVQEPFMIVVKAVLILGLIISSPWVFYQIWNFVASGLYPHERRQVFTYLPFSLGLFFAGAALAFLFVFQPVLDFLFGFNLLLNIDASPRINEWVGFVLFLPVGFGLSFQLPLVMLLLERMGVLTVDAYRNKWRIAILVIFALSMFLTPADPTSMLLMAIPLTFLYFGGITLCLHLPRSQSPIGPATDPT